MNRKNDNFFKRHFLSLLFGVLLGGFTIYLLLDTFVISSTFQSDATQMNMDLFENVSATASVQSDNEQKAEEESRTPARTDISQDDAEEDRAPARRSSSQEDTKDDDLTPSRRSSSQEDAEDDRNPPRRGSSQDDEEDENTEDDNEVPTASYFGYEKELVLTGPNKHERSTRSSDYSDYYERAWGDTLEVTETADLTEPLTYEDENISITITEYEENETHIYVADIVVTSAEYLKTAFAEDTYGRNITAPTSEIAETHNAILAINGDYYGARYTGYVIRNGILYRDEGNDEEVLCIYADGTMEVVDPDQYTAEELIEKGAWQALCFGPGLIENGEITVSEEDEVGRAKASNPRTAIGVIEANHYLFVVSDGRTDESDGLSLLELAEFMQSLGAITAYNLDGGGSSTMVFNGLIVNTPTGGMSISERSVSDIVYIG